MNTEFLLTSFIVVASPGTGALVTVAAGLSHGARTSLLAALGCTVGVLPHMLVAITGLAALFHTSALAFEAVKFAGVAYLLYMAWKTLQDKGGLHPDKGGAAPSGRDVIVNAILLNLLNPKLSIFFLAFLPQFISPEEPRAAQAMLSLSAVFMGMTFVVFALYGVFAAHLRDRVLARPRVVNGLRMGFALAFLGLGVKLAILRP